MRILTGVLILCLVLSCKSNNRIPKDILQPEEMGNILFSVTMAEEFVGGYIAKDTLRNKDQELEKEYQKVFLLYNISKEDFEKSYSFYKTRPDLLKTILDTLDARAQRRRIELHQPLEY